MPVNEKTDLVVKGYVRSQFPVLDESMKRYFRDELQRIEAAITTLANAAIQVTDDPPDEPVKGMIRYAISPWNPTGAGDGLYIYNGSAWVAV
jgi:hypothetical protein